MQSCQQLVLQATLQPNFTTALTHMSKNSLLTSPQNIVTFLAGYIVACTQSLTLNMLLRKQG